jgi:hypothetical protein
MQRRPETSMSPSFKPLVLLALLAGCVPNGEGAWTRTRGAPITNGDPDSGHPAVGVVLRSDREVCSGSLIGSRSVLTSAHCVEPVGDYAFRVEGKTYFARWVSRHPAYEADIVLPELPDEGDLWLDNDIRFLSLTDEVMGVEPLLLSRREPKLHEPIVLVGWGKTGLDAGIDTWDKHQASNTIGSIGAKYFFFGSGLGLSGGQANICLGDSGGPTIVLEGDMEQILGVHSMYDTETCQRFGYDMRADFYREWILGQAQDDYGRRALPKDEGRDMNTMANDLDGRAENAPYPDETQRENGCQLGRVRPPSWEGGLDGLIIGLFFVILRATGEDREPRCQDAARRKKKRTASA